MTITLAETEAERKDVLALFLDTFVDIAPNAVPTPDVDHLYRSLIVQVRNSSGTLLAAALTCLPQKAAGMALMPEPMRPPGLSKAAERVSELIEFLEPLLTARGVRTWFGNATADLDVDALRRFYAEVGFRVLAKRQALPPFGGQEWTMPLTEEPAFYFWKQLRPSRAAQESTSYFAISGPPHVPRREPRRVVQRQGSLGRPR